jgi:rhodanese-related sulfurtransferase
MNPGLVMLRIFALAALLSSSCAFAQALQPVPTAERIDTLSRMALKQMMSIGAIVLVDVREPDEFRSGRIPGARLLPMSTFSVAKIPVEIGKRIVLYCYSGARARQALAMARASGRTDVAIYPGSMIDWEGAREPIEK